MAKKRKRPEPDTANHKDSQQPATPALNGTHTLESTPPEALPPPEAQLRSASDDLVSLHRARFVPWQPTAVVASATSNDGSLVAITHESGALEIWETTSWTCRQVLAWQSSSQHPLCTFCNPAGLGKSPFFQKGTAQYSPLKSDLNEPLELLVHT